MPLAGGAQTQNEPQRAGRQTRLVRVRHHGGIEQGRRFQGVFVGKIGANQKLALLGDFLIGQQRLLDPFKARHEKITGLLMAFGKFAQDLVQQRPDLLFRKRHHPRANVDHALVGRQPEWTN